MKFSLFISIFTIVSLQFGKAQSPIIPAPVTHVFVEGRIDFTEQFTIKTVNLSQKLKDYLVGELENSFAISTNVLPPSQISSTI